MSDFIMSQPRIVGTSNRRRDQVPGGVWASALVLGIAYYVGAKVGFALTFDPHPVSTLWPPNAILLAALLLYYSLRPDGGGCSYSRHSRLTWL